MKKGWTSAMPPLSDRGWGNYPENSHVNGYATNECADLFPGLLWRSNECGLYTYLNQGWLNLTGRSLEEEVGLGWIEGVHPEDVKKTLDTYAAASTYRKPFYRSFRLKSKEGEYRWIRDFGVQVLESNGSLSGYTGTGLDFTHEYVVQDSLQQKLQQKETLLQEAHHRFKNNLQVLTSLLQLQSQELTLENLRTILVDCQNRIQAIALMHERLSWSDSNKVTPFADYVREVARIVMASYDVRNVTLSLEVDSLNLRSNQMMPCGLIVHELLSNSLKHAFPSGTRGQIRIRFYSTPAQYCLEVSDGGIGLSREVELNRSRTLGLRLVSLLSQQLGGTLKLEREAGTKIEVRFPRIA